MQLKSPPAVRRLSETFQLRTLYLSCNQVTFRERTVRRALNKIPTEGESTLIDVTLWRIFLLHLRVGNLTFGGGDPTLAAMHSEIVGTRRWVSSERYALIFALARITPGTNLLAFCTGISWELKGWIGAVVAVLAMTGPAACIVVLMTGGYAAMRSNPLAIAVIGGILASAVGMMVAAAWQLARPYLDRRRGLHAAVVIASAITLSAAFSMSPILVIALAAAAGAIWRIPE
jgi:chromate transporter